MSLQKKGLVLVCAVSLSACGGGGSSTPAPNPNTAPTLTDPGAITLLEGGAVVATIAGTDSENDSLTFALSSGDDENLFRMSSSGELSFITAPDFEIPSDAGGDNIYEVTVQVSDGALLDTQALTVTITDAFEGRVVDAPIKGARVFIDLNGDGVQDDDEPSGVTDDNGFFNVTMFELPAGSSAKVISRGGTDILTGQELPDLALISDVPSDITKPANVTPLTTVLAAVDTAEGKAELLAAMGITGTPEALLTSDGWAAAAEGDTGAMATQRINQQLGLLLQTAAAALEGSGSTADLSIKLAQSVAAEVKKAASSATGLDLTSAEALQTVLTEALSDAAPEVAIEAATLTAVATSVASVNTVVADPKLDPLSDVSAEIVKAAQTNLQSSVKDVVAGTVSVDVFNTDTGLTDLFTNVVLPADAIDTDEDGIADALDTDDDGDGVKDNVDAFPKDATETKDADNDGLGDNADDFIPADYDDGIFDEFDWS
ncbi:hypothetical protein N9W42_02905 [Pseudomonadales bacterium]|nr:hypothetical protein [Pseudomonadales bacterium]